MKDTSSLYPEAHIYPPARSNMDLCRNSFEESLIPAFRAYYGHYDIHF